jgi:predicted phage replisome organizer
MEYSLILLKMYLRSLKGEGKLMFRNLIPYTPETLAKVLRHDVEIVKKAIDIFESLGLIEKLDGGAIFMTDIQTFIGESSTEADRKRAYRARIEREMEAQRQSQHHETGRNILKWRSGVSPVPPHQVYCSEVPGQCQTRKLLNRYRKA